MRISHLFDDPFVRALCEAAERDEGGAGAIVAPELAPRLTDGAVADLLELEDA